MRLPTPPRTRRRLLVLGVLPLALLAAACGSSSPGAAAPTATTTATTSAPAAPSSSSTTTSSVAHPVVATMTVGSLGKILVNSEGQVLYTFTNNGTPVPCDSGCLAAWPPLVLPPGVTTPTGAPGVGTLGTTKANGLTQVTVNGLPLFTYAGDSGPGVADGNNVVSFGGTWKVVKAS